VLAIELDDSSHLREDRKFRDAEVERVLEVAELPLLRLIKNDALNPQELREKINALN